MNRQEHNRRDMRENQDSWLESITQQIPPDYPLALRQELRAVFQLASEHHTLWSDDEINGLRELFTSKENARVFTHIAKFIDPVWWNNVVNLFKDAYTETASAYHRKSEGYISDRADSTWGYADIAQKSSELLDLLGVISPNDEGFREDIDSLINNSNLTKTLLQLIATTTDCHWPNAALAQSYGYGDPGKWGHALQMGEAERQEVYRVKKMGKKKAEALSDDEFFALPEGEVEFVGYIYRRNDEYLKACQESPAPLADYSRDRIIINKNDRQGPPIFEPLIKEQQFTAWPQTFLRNLISKLDQYSTELGRPPRVWKDGSQNGTTCADPLWLSVDHCRALVSQRCTSDDESLTRTITGILQT